MLTLYNVALCAVGDAGAEGKLGFNSEFEIF